MPEYADKFLTWFEHTPPRNPQHSPHVAPPQQFRHNAQIPVNHDNLLVLPVPQIWCIQQIIGTIRHNAWAVDVTTLVTLSNIAAKQTTSMEATEKLVTQLMDYLHTHKDATILYVASDIVLSVHSDASYL